MKNLIYIFLGGGFGSIARYLISVYFQRNFLVGSFPMGTLIVNVIGCFLIGVFTTYFIKHDSSLRFLLITGICGGFTTFSTFSAENYNLWESQNYTTLFLYIILSVVLGFGAVVLGVKCQNLI